MTDPGFPCYRCGAARGCQHRPAPKPVFIEFGPPPRQIKDRRGPRGAYNTHYERKK